MPMWSDLQLRPEVHLLEELIRDRPSTAKRAKRNQNRHLRRFAIFAVPES